MSRKERHQRYIKRLVVQGLAAVGALSLLALIYAGFIVWVFVGLRFIEIVGDMVL